MWEPLQRRSRSSGPVLGRHPSPLKRLPHSHSCSQSATGTQSQDCEPCSPITPPQCSEEPAGTTLGAGSRRRGQRVEKARRGPAMGGPAVSAETGSRIGNLHSQPDPSRRAIDKRPLFAALPFRVAAGVAPRVVPAGSCEVARRAKREAEGEPSPTSEEQKNAPLTKGVP